MSKWTIWSNLGWAVTCTAICGSKLLICFFQLLLHMTAILVIFKVVFVVYGLVECQAGQFGGVWDGVQHSEYPVKVSN